MGSRYRRLNLRERAFAPCLFKALLAGSGRIARGERNVVAITEHAGQVLHQDEYFDLVDPETIRPIDVVEGPVRAALAVWIGEIRLIDKVLCEPGYAQ